MSNLDMANEIPTYFLEPILDVKVTVLGWCLIVLNSSHLRLGVYTLDRSSHPACSGFTPKHTAISHPQVRTELLQLIITDHPNKSFGSRIVVEWNTKSHIWNPNKKDPQTLSSPEAKVSWFGKLLRHHGIFCQLYFNWSIIFGPFLVLHVLRKHGPLDAWCLKHVVPGLGGTFSTLSPQCTDSVEEASTIPEGFHGDREGFFHEG